jgi:hypothetical protein
LATPKAALKYKFTLVSQFKQKIRIVIDQTIIQLKPHIETDVELTSYQKQILDKLIVDPYKNKIAFIEKEEEGN